MTTLGDLVNSIASALHSYTGVQEVSTYLTSGVTANALTFPVAASDQVVRGVIEVDDELVYVDVADSGTLTIPPFGRGYRGSTAATHALNAQVVVDPSFPRSEIRRAVDQTIQGLYPTLYKISTTDLTVNATPIGYALPADCEGILDVKFQTVNDPVDYWQPIFNYSFDSSSPEATGKALNIFDWLPPGSTARVVYQSRFGGAYSADASVLLGDLGLNDEWADLITYAVTSRMIRFLEPARLQIRSVENISRGQLVPVGDAGKVANQLYAIYQQRLQEERRKLLDLYPPRPHFQR